MGSLALFPWICWKKISGVDRALVLEKVVELDCVRPDSHTFASDFINNLHSSNSVSKIPTAYLFLSSLNYSWLMQNLLPIALNEFIVFWLLNLNGDLKTVLTGRALALGENWPFEKFFCWNMTWWKLVLKFNRSHGCLGLFESCLIVILQINRPHHFRIFRFLPAFNLSLSLFVKNPLPLIFPFLFSKPPSLLVLKLYLFSRQNS